MRKYSLRYRAEVLAISISTAIYACIIGGSSILIHNDRHNRHERHAMSVMESIQSKKMEGDKALADFVNDYSNARLLVWISRGDQQDVVMPSGKSSINLQNKELLKLVDYKSTSMSNATNLSWNGNQYFACSMPGPDNTFSVRFLEDVGVDPLATKATWIGLFLFWIGISTLSIIAIKIGSFVLLTPVRKSSNMISKISLDDLDDSRMMAEIAQDNSPLELQGFLKEYTNLLSRIQSDYENTKFVIRGVGHEMREGFSTAMNCISKLERTVLSPLQKTELIRSCKSSIASSVNTLDNILRLAKNESGITSINSTDLRLKELIDLFRYQFENSDNSFPISVVSTIDKDLIENIIVTIDPNVLTWAVESLVLNARKYAFTTQGAVITISTSDQTSLIIVVSDFGPGIDIKDRKKIFNRYSRGVNANDAPGTGIGLAVVSELLKMINANISVIDSSKGFGASFQIIVPELKSEVR